MSVKQNIKDILKKYLNINVQMLKKGSGSGSSRYSYQKKYVDFNIGKNDKVLDVGSGGYPFPPATHLADLYCGETTHRSEKFVSDKRPVTVCDILNMPFANKEFDFVYCSHVLEHVQDPARACEELMRVGRRGYIETPTRLSDIMLNFTRLKEHHKWHINHLGNTIVFMEWKDAERRDMGTKHFEEELLSPWKNPFQDMFNDNIDMFVNMMQWNDRFDYIVIDKNGEILSTAKKIN